MNHFGRVTFFFVPVAKAELDNDWLCFAFAVVKPDNQSAFSLDLWIALDFKVCVFFITGNYKLAGSEVTDFDDCLVGLIVV